MATIQDETFPLVTSDEFLDWLVDLGVLLHFFLHDGILCENSWWVNGWAALAQELTGAEKVLWNSDRPAPVIRPKQSSKDSVSRVLSLSFTGAGLCAQRNQTDQKRILISKRCSQFLEYGDVNSLSAQPYLGGIGSILPSNGRQINFLCRDNWVAIRSIVSSSLTPANPHEQ